MAPFEPPPRAGREHGRLTAIVARTDHGHEVLEAARLTPEGGLPGDAWARRLVRSLETQINAMETEVARLLAAGQPLSTFGDNLFLELDLSQENLPPGSRVRVGEALLEVTAKPHTGCQKFVARFGQEALDLVSRPDLRDRNLRGIHLRVLEAGEIRSGDAVVVRKRASDGE